MRANESQTPEGGGFTPTVGITVVNARRRGAEGVIKSEPFLCTFPSGGPRWRVWVDYSNSRGVVAIDDVNELEIVPERGASVG